MSQTRQFHHTSIFADSQLEAGRAIEELRLRRADLRRDQRESLLKQEAAVVAAGEAAHAERMVAGRRLAGLATDEEVKRAATQRKTAERAQARSAQRAGEVAAAIEAVEAEMTRLLTENRQALIGEQTEAFEAQRALVFEASEAQARALAGLHELLRGIWATYAAFGDALPHWLPDPGQLAQLARDVEALAARVPGPLPEALATEVLA